MKTVISIILVWLGIAVATAWAWHRLRRHEHYMESLLPNNDEPCSDCGGKGFTYSDPDSKQMVCHACEGEEP